MPHTYTVTDQVKFLTEWFDSWSELQKDDFLPILAQSLAPAQNVNGLVEAPMQGDRSSGRRPSLFDCQVKLFHDWYDSWSDEDKIRFLNHVAASDPEFSARLEKLKDVEPMDQPVPVGVPPAMDAPGAAIDEAEEVDDGVAAGSSTSSPASSLTPSQSNNDSGLDERQSDGEDPAPPIQALQGLQVLDD